jgi:crossover junction endodeoxyribonuclease RusA
MPMIVVTLPFPDARLNPNRSKGVHWAATSALRKSARSSAWTLTRVAASSTPWYGTERRKSETVPLTITFIQPDRRRRDRDNLLAACKPALDGVADALEINDSQFEPVLIRREYGAKPGGVRIEIGATGDQQTKAE